MNGAAACFAAYQAEFQAAPGVLPEVWAKNGHSPGGIPGGAGCFA